MPESSWEMDDMAALDADPVDDGTEDSSSSEDAPANTQTRYVYLIFQICVYTCVFYCDKLIVLHPCTFS